MVVLCAASVIVHATLDCICSCCVMSVPRMHVEASSLVMQPVSASALMAHASSLRSVSVGGSRCFQLKATSLRTLDPHLCQPMDLVTWRLLLEAKSLRLISTIRAFACFHLTAKRCWKNGAAMAAAIANSCDLMRLRCLVHACTSWMNRACKSSVDAKYSDTNLRRAGNAAETPSETQLFDLHKTCRNNDQWPVALLIIHWLCYIRTSQTNK